MAAVKRTRFPRMARYRLARGMDLKHERRPWTVGPDGTTVIMAGEPVIVSPAVDGTSLEMMRANARLIASAPAMLSMILDLAAYEDTNANEQLEATGSYSSFDNGDLVMIARAILDDIRGVKS